MSQLAPLSCAALTLYLLVAGGCAADPPAAPAAAEPQASADFASAKPGEPGEVKAPLSETRFGAPITDGAATTLASLVASPTQFAGKTVKTEGVVKSVCKAAGCWMEIGDDTGRAHIKMAGHAFFVPKNCDGHRAVVQGKVKEGAPEDACGAKDGCGGEDNGALAKLEIEATGVEFLD